MDIRSIAALVGANKFDRAGITSFLRLNLVENPSAIESLASEIAGSSPHPDERNNRLSSLRVLMSKVSEELGLPKHTVKQYGAIYRVEKSISTVRSAPDPFNPAIYRPLRKAAESATQAEKEQMLSLVLEILGKAGRP